MLLKGAIIAERKTPNLKPSMKHNIDSWQLMAVSIIKDIIWNLIPYNGRDAQLKICFYQNMYYI